MQTRTDRLAMTRHGTGWAVKLGLAASLFCVSGTAIAQTERISVVGLDEENLADIDVPAIVDEKANLVYELHRRAWGVPMIETFLGKDRVIFLVKRAETTPTAAVSGNYQPIVVSDYSNQKVAERFCQGGFGASIAERIDGKEYARGWCQGSFFSAKIYADKADHWSMPALLSHEFVHLKQAQLPDGKTVRMPEWIGEGQGNGFGFGMMEYQAGLSMPAIAKSAAIRTDQNFPFFLGLRYYDSPLAVDNWASSYPTDHPGYPVDKASDPDIEPGDPDPDPPYHISMAGYMTGSFWRHVLRARPGGYAVARAFFRTPSPKQAKDRAWLPWVDTILKTTREPKTGAIVWEGGLRTAFSEMIVELADRPDLSVKSRAGKLREYTYDRLLWRKGCTKVDLTSQPTAVVAGVEIAQIAARCFTIKLPPDGVDMSGENAKPILTGSMGSQFSVTATSKVGACRDLELGTRGQLIRSPTIDNLLGNVNDCRITWKGYYLPLGLKHPNGRNGWQTVVLVNAPDDPTRAKRHVVDLTFLRPTATATITSQPFVKVRDRKVRRKAPSPPPGKPAPQSASPVIVKPDDGSVCEAEQRALLECGPLTGITVAFGDQAKFATTGAAMLDSIQLHYLAGSFTTPDQKTMGDLLYDASQEEMAAVGAMTQRMAASGSYPSGSLIAIAMKQLADGETGTFPARMELLWGDGQPGEPGRPESVKPARTTASNDCVNVDSYALDAMVTITHNDAGALVGSASGRMWEENPDEETSCRQPYVMVGTVEVAFASPSQINLGTRELDLETRTVRNAKIDESIIAQTRIPIEERSDVLGDEGAGTGGAGAGPGAGGDGSGGGSGVLATGKCSAASLTRNDLMGFIRAMISSDGEPPTPEMEAQFASVDLAPYAPAICQWIAAGRPARFTLGDE
ncbi:hypothetical protein ACPVPU_03345 [Sphingomonas sp. CJ99]